MRLVAFVALAGCGRIDFEPVRTLDQLACDAWGPFGAPVRLDDAVQSNGDDWGASPSADGLELVFYSYRSAGPGGGDIYDSVRASIQDPWPAPSLIPSVETMDRDAEPSLTEDRLDLVYAASSGTDTKIKLAHRASLGDPFGAPTVVAGVDGLVVVELPTESQPFVSLDGLRLVYRSSTSGSRQLLEATRPDRSSAFNVIGPLLSPTNDGDGDPALSSDGLELIFDSDGRGGAGGFDLFVAHRTALDQAFGAPVPISELETAMDEVNARPSADGTQLYLDYNTVSAGNSNSDMMVATRGCL